MNILEKGLFEILTPKIFLEKYMLLIEKAGRTCYKSEKGKITHSSASKFIKMLIERKHFSVLEHGYLTVKFTHVSRGLTHELVRHRLGSFSQESTRYVDYLKGYKNPDLEKFQASFILPPHKDKDQKMSLRDGTDRRMSAYDMLEEIELFYRTLRQNGWLPEDARQLLPNALNSDIVVSANFREWRHIFFMRTSKQAHWEIRSIMSELLEEVKILLSPIFDDFEQAGIDINNLPYYKCKNKD